jgi:hypothetical protein
MAALTNPIVVLMELSLLCVQLFPVKIMSVTDATVSPQVEGIRVSLCLIQVFLHYLGRCDVLALVHGAFYWLQKNPAPRPIKKSPATPLCKGENQWSYPKRYPSSPFSKGWDRRVFKADRVITSMHDLPMVARRTLGFWRELWQHGVWLQPFPVSGITQGRGERLNSDMRIFKKRDL